MDAIATARVPVEVKNQAAHILRRIGATQTDLINASYQYLLDTGQLPDAKDNGGGLKAQTHGTRPVYRRLSDSQRAEFEDFIRAVRVPEPADGWDERNDREILAEGRAADYEALG